MIIKELFKIKNFKSKVFLKNVILSFIVFILPILFLIVINNNLLNLIKNEVTKSGKINLKNSMENIENNFTALNSAAISMANNRMLMNYNIRDNYYTHSEVISTLKGYFHTIGFVDDVFFSLRNADYIYSSSIYDRKDKFFNNDFVTQTEFQEIRRWFDETITPELVPSQSCYKYNGEPKNYLLYVVPISSNNPFATAVFAVHEQWFESQLSSIFAEHTAETYIVDGKGNLLTSVKTDKSDVISVENLLGNMGDNTEYYEETSNNIILSITSPNSGRKYISVMNKESVFANVNQLKYMIILFTMIIFLLGILIIIINSYYIYAPIYSLRSRFEKGNSLDDFEVINCAIDNIETTNKSLKEIIERQSNDIRGLFLKEVVSTGKASIRSFDSDCASEIINSKESCFFRIAILKVGAEAKNHGTLSMLGIKSALFSGNSVEFYEVAYEYDDAFVLLFKYRMSEEEFAIYINGIYEVVNKNVCDNAVLIIGIRRNDLFDIKDSYLRATLAYNSNNIGGMIFVEESDKKEAQYPYEEITKLTNVLNKRRMSEIRAQLDIIKQLVKEENMGLFVKKCVVFDLLNLTIKLGYKYKADNEYLLKKMTLWQDDGAITKVDEIFKILEQNFEAMFAKKINIAHEFVDKVLFYIKNNYTDCNLSVQAIADEFDVSTTYLNQTFKDEIGDNIHDYITSLRMETAKELLKTTDMSVKDIVEAIGYFNVSSFGRKFKTVTGVTPSEYRNE